MFLGANKYKIPEFRQKTSYVQTVEPFGHLETGPFIFLEARSSDLVSEDGILQFNPLPSFTTCRFHKDDVPPFPFFSAVKGEKKGFAQPNFLEYWGEPGIQPIKLYKF